MTSCGSVGCCAATGGSGVNGRETSGAAKLGAATDSTTGGCDPATGRCTKAYIVPALGAPFVIDGRDVRIGVTVGIALAPRDGVTLDRLAASADAALYQAKHKGRGSVLLAGKPSGPSAAVTAA